MIKIVYFDEYSATDYLNIYNGGQLISTLEKSKQKEHDLKGNVDTGLKGKLSWLSLLGIEANVAMNTSYSTVGTNLINTTISNTILTDFIKEAQEDSRIYKKRGYKLRTYPNSIAFYKIFTPYLIITKSSMTTDQGFEMDLSRMDEAFQNGKGYYEIIAEKSEGEIVEKCILRFNLNAFRNSYSIADLLKMDLEYYVIKVGRVFEETLDINKEFNLEEKLVTEYNELEDGRSSSEELDVFDVILAGVTQ